MIRRLGPVIFVLPLLVILFLVLGFEWLRGGGSDYEPPVGVTAEAVLASPDGGDLGTVTLTQGSAGVIVAADVQGLTPGGHAVSINAVGACEPDFAAAGDHFDPEGGQGFLHDSWKKGQGVGPHGGDLPNLYANADGTARADFFTAGITLGTGVDHSVFDDDGSAIIIYEQADTYSEEHGAGDRVACGVIRLR